MRAGTQIVHGVTRVIRGSQRRDECTELTDQGRQLRNITTPNQSVEGLETWIHDEISEEMGQKHKILMQCSPVKKHWERNALRNLQWQHYRLTDQGRRDRNHKGPIQKDKKEN